MIYAYISGRRDDAKINAGNLSENFRKRAYFYRDEKKRADSLRGYFILYNALSRLGFDAGGADISTGENGKPFIAGCPYKFNLSHSFGTSFCVIGKEEVGCDVEKIREVDFSVAKRFFSADESERVFSFDGELKKNEFFKIWTAKESFMKAVGKGFSLLPSSFSVLDKNGELCKIKDGLILNAFIKDGFCFSFFSAEEQFEINIYDKENTNGKN